MILQRWVLYCHQTSVFCLDHWNLYKCLVAKGQNVLPNVFLGMCLIFLLSVSFPFYLMMWNFLIVFVHIVNSFNNYHNFNLLLQECISVSDDKISTWSTKLDFFTFAVFADLCWWDVTVIVMYVVTLCTCTFGVMPEMTLH